MPLPCAVSISLQYLLMFAFVSLAAAQGGIMDTARSMGETFGFNSWAFVSQILSFSIVCAAQTDHACAAPTPISERFSCRTHLAARPPSATISNISGSRHPSWINLPGGPQGGDELSPRGI